MMMRFPPVASAALVALLANTTAHAQPAGAQAEVLFERGIALVKEGKYVEACAAFDASDKLEPAIATVLRRADCREKAGDFATAWGLFLDAERRTRAATDPTTQKLHLVAIEHAAKLEPRLSRLTINVAERVRLPGLVVARGAEVVDIGAWNHALPVDGGNYTITARAPGYETWAAVVEVAPEHDTASIDVPTLVRAPVIAKPHRSKLPFILGGAGVAGLGAALALELAAERTHRASQLEANDARQDSLWRRANAERYAAGAFAVAGLACAGLAVWRFLRHPMVRERPQLAVQPLVGNHPGLVLVRPF